MNVVKFIKSQVKNNEKISLYKICFMVMRAISESVEPDIVSLIASPNEYYSTDSDEIKEQKILSIVKIMSKYDDENPSATHDIEELLSQIILEELPRGNVHLLK